MQIYISAIKTKTKDGDIREHRLIIGMEKPPRLAGREEVRLY